MSDRFRLEIAYSHTDIGVRLIASCHDWHGASGTIKLTGSFSPDEAIIFAAALRAKAEEIAAKNAKRDAAEQRRQARSAKLPQMSWTRR